MKNLKLKICGLNDYDNIKGIAKLQTDFMGFIFWKTSKRYCNLETLPNLYDGIKKVGVFVDPSLDEIMEKIAPFKLDYIQLHGNETPEFCEKVHWTNCKVIKAFTIDDTFDFGVLLPYMKSVDYFLFDAKGSNPGGNGITFNWKKLNHYKLEKPFFLSGGIGLEEISKIDDFIKTDVGKYCFAIDINSRFETLPGSKNTLQITQFKNKLYEINI
jgi:phosphoribosylanthranilate isomerase